MKWYWYLALGCFAVILVVLFVDRSPAVSYGPGPGQMKMDPDEAAPGEVVYIVFKEITWFRPCPSWFAMTITDSEGHRVDDSHIIDYPDGPIILKNKRRLWQLPKRRIDAEGKCTTMCLGEAEIVGQTNSICKMLDFVWWIRTDRVRAKLTIR